MNMMFEWIMAVVFALGLLFLVTPEHPDPPPADDQEDW